MIEVDKEPELKVVNPPRVRVNLGFTRNVGNYESLRIEVGLEGSALEGESSAVAFDRIYKFVETRLIEKFGETEETLKAQGLGKED